MFKTTIDAAALVLLFALLIVLYAISPELDEILRGLRQ